MHAEVNSMVVSLRNAAGPSDELLISCLGNRLSSSLRATDLQPTCSLPAAYLQPTCSLPARKNAYSSRWLRFYACLFEANTKAEASAEAAKAGAELEAEAEAKAKAEAKAAKAEAKAEVAQAVAKGAQAAKITRMRNSKSASRRQKGFLLRSCIHTSQGEPLGYKRFPTYCLGAPHASCSSDQQTNPAQKKMLGRAASNCSLTWASYVHRA